MKYFCKSSERQGTLYHELFPGEFDPDTDHIWNEDSILIHDDLFHDSGLYHMLREIKYGYDPYDNEVVSPEQWAELESRALTAGGTAAEIVREASPWVEAAFGEKGCFTIIGL